MKSHASFYRAGIGLLAVFWLAACSARSTATVADQPAVRVGSQPQIGLRPAAQDTPAGAQPAAAVQPVATTPACASPATLTPAVTEGPYFKANSPERASLVEADTPGTRLTLTGVVLTADCRPVVHALLDFWQANAAGQYDNTGYTLRGHQYTDASGHYQLDTIVPGLYPGRTEHIHVKVQAPNGPVLTSQLFFPGVSNNGSDQIFDPALVIHITQDSGGSIQATFDFLIQP